MQLVEAFRFIYGTLGQGRNDRGQEGHNSLGTELLRRRRITAGAPNHCEGREMTTRNEKSPNNVTKLSLMQYIASKRPQVLTYGRQTSSLPRAPPNLVTPLP